MMPAKLLYRGSVKDIYEDPENPERLLFKFSDRYSVFDWGEMPDLIEGKGQTLAEMGLFFFEWLSSGETWKNWKPHYNLKKSELAVLETLKGQGLKNHSLGKHPCDRDSFYVKKVNVPKVPFDDGRYDYSSYQLRPENTLVPLEVIFRFGLPSGSSLFERLEDEDYRRELGLHHIPKEGESFNRPLIEFSTKLETTDRYIKYEEAQRISGLSDREFSELYAHNIILACRLKDLFFESGIELWDGKFEWAFGQDHEGRGFELVDSIGPDELRLMKEGQKLSKEFLRGFYRQSEWLKAVKLAKEDARRLGIKEWHPIVKDKYKEAPKQLDKCFYKAAHALYPALLRELKGSSSDEGEMSLEEVIKLMKDCEASL